MTSLKPNLVKRIQRLPKPSNAGSALQPLFEAIMNAIHSCQLKHGVNVEAFGKVVVTVSVDRRKATVLATVEDNGFGLDAKNWEAFTTTDTDNKIQFGGKGVGRLLWLDCFQEINVSSQFNEAGQIFKRSFDFVLAVDEQIQNESLMPIEGQVETGFHVRFANLKDNGYLNKFPGRGNFVFQHLTSHFLPIFIGKRCPKISVNIADETRSYPDDINKIVHRREPEIALRTNDYELLKLTLMECDKVASADLKGSHFVHFIAHDRTVHSRSIDGKLGLKYFGENEDHVFHAILTGDYLDKNVNQERTSFIFEDAVIDRIVNDACIEHIEKFLEVPLAKLRNEQKVTIEAIAESYPSVAFGDVKELQSKIPSGELNGDAIYGHLSRERFRRDERQAEKIRSVLTRLKDTTIDIETFKAAIKEAGKAIEDSEQRSLAEYVVRRKVVLDFIEILLQNVRDDSCDSSYQREDILHSFICPVRTNTLESGEKSINAASSHDLWIIDERLTFAQYFSSDVDFKTLSSSIDSDERPDVLIFDHVHGLRQTEDSSKVLLVEFKRPGRAAYHDSENPQHQVEKYVKRLLSGDLRDVKGRPIKLDTNTIFYCFIIADIVGKLDDWTFSWQRTADGRGRVYQPRDGFKGSIELIGWDALLSDARARNQAFFDKSGISGKSFFSE